MPDRDDRGRDVEQRLSKRFESEQTDESDTADKPDMKSKTDKTDNTSKTDMTSQTAQSTDSEKSVKDRPSVLMYLPEDVRQDLDIRFDELNARYKREHGEALEKNRDYYPAVVEAGLTGKDVEDLLDI
ncbi:hypothetical protein [Haloplanus vescus]|nr:hypothetical protein [Haloplanus vescus]